jgi:hypothetical protein
VSLLTCNRTSPSETAIRLRPPSHRGKILLVFVTLVSTLGRPSLIALSAAQSTAPTQDDVEAAYLFNFAKFVTWPANSRANVLNICILGKDPFGATLDNIVAGETIEGRRLAVLRLPRATSAAPCSILFINESEASHVDKDLSAVAKLPILTVSDISGFMRDGGTIEFVLSDKRVRFEVNLSAARRHGIVLSSQLLKVANEVVGISSQEGVR